MKNKEEIIKLLNSYTSKAYSKGSCGELGDDFMAIDSDSFEELSEDIYKYIKSLQHFKDTASGLFATDKEPNKIFELVMNTIDGDQCMSALDYEYYKNIFDTELSKLMFQIK